MQFATLSRMLVNLAHTGSLLLALWDILFIFAKIVQQSLRFLFNNWYHILDMQAAILVHILYGQIYYAHIFAKF